MMTILLLTMWIIPGYAAVEAVREPDAECAVSDAVPCDVDVLYEMSMRRDTSKPSSLWDLSSSSYRASGSIRVGRIRSIISIPTAAEKST